MARTKLNADGLVIGGGAAGITAARTLHEAGLDVVVVEARERSWRPHLHSTRQCHPGADRAAPSSSTGVRLSSRACCTRHRCRALTSAARVGSPWTDGCVVWTISGSGSTARCGATLRSGLAPQTASPAVRWKPVPRSLRSRSGFSRRRLTNLAQSPSFPSSGRSRRPSKTLRTRRVQLSSRRRNRGATHDGSAD
jgi:choline dehydrogenase-like flavoprotein